MVLISFNSGDSTTQMEGFSLKWYREIFRDHGTLQAFRNTLVLSVLAAVLATVIGTLAAVDIHKMRSKRLRSAVMTVTNIPMMNPDIVTGISLMLLFVFAARMLNLETTLSFYTLLIAHITFCLPYVILNVLPKLRQMDKNLPEAAQDLGCTPLQSFFKVELPFIMPSVWTAMIMAFTLSFDNFVISNFTSGSSYETLTIHIYSMIKKSVKPNIYSLSTIIFFAVLVLLIVYNFTDSADDRRERAIERANLRRERRLRKERGELVEE
ncbi:MAG: ABC transporter permease [Firmicutes bacterium]|nr:ABC transporter permease [Bacillota bacterium]